MFVVVLKILTFSSSSGLLLYSCTHLCLIVEKSNKILEKGQVKYSNFINGVVAFTLPSHDN